MRLRQPRFLSIVSSLILSIGLSDVSPAAEPEGGGDEDDVQHLETVTTVASKVRRPLRDVVGTVSAIGDAEIERYLVQDIEDLVRYEPGLSVGREASRFGLSGFNIRGISANRVAVELDGVPVADGFLIGDFSNAGRDYVDPALLKRVEILRGPASALYGSDAIGGVVTYHTKDPRDLLTGSGDGFYAGGSTHLNSDDDSWVQTGRLALPGERMDSMLGIAYRDGHELEAAGGAANPQDWDALNVLGKLVFRTGDGDRIRMTVDGGRMDSRTRVANLAPGPGRYASTTRLEGDDHQERLRWSLDGQLGDGWWGSDGVWRVWTQTSETRQDTLQELAPSGSSPDPTRRERRFEYQQRTVGAEATVERRIFTEGAEHRLTYGAEAIQTTTEELRDGTLTNLNTGDQTNVIIGEVFPVRDFPITETDELGLYVQDEYIPDGSAFTLIPALRAEYYHLNPEPDAIYRADNPATDTVAVTETSLTPRLGAIYRLSERSSLYAQYARGFRSPPFEDVNIGLEIPIFGIRAIPNPDLEPERSDGLELGYRMEADSGWMDAVLFYNDYEDLIESKVNLGFDPTTGFLIFQSLNREEARIYGAEFRGELELGSLSDGMSGWKGHLSFAYADGEDTARDLPLNSVDPMELILGLAYAPPSERWGVELVATAVAGKDADDVDQSSTNLFLPGGYATLDLVGHYQLSDDARIRWGLFNLTDRRYWQWSDVRGVPAGDPVIDLYARPGTNVSLSFDYDF